MCACRSLIMYILTFQSRQPSREIHEQAVFGAGAPAAARHRGGGRGPGAGAGRRAQAARRTCRARRGAAQQARQALLSRDWALVTRGARHS